MSSESRDASTRWWRVIGPGLLVAATGVGAADLATSTFTGMRLGVTVLWAVIFGAFLKFVLTEGLARYQLATGDTVIEGAVKNLGKPFVAIFMAYFLLWSFVVGGALASGAGVGAHALFPLFEDPVLAKRIFGAFHSALGVALVLGGGYRLFERVMRVCIAVMFACVILTAVRVGTDWPAAARGIVAPNFQSFSGEALQWTIALLGGVGGTLTILCYGYWIREEDREGIGWLRKCRVDLAVGYIMTALFGIAMVMIGSRVTSEGSGASLIADLGKALAETIGPGGQIVFLIGAYGAIFSSLLGVWQCVPLIFADIFSLTTKKGARLPIDETGLPYRGYLIALATVSCVPLFVNFQTIQLVYGIIGAFFMPLLSGMLLYLNGPAMPHHEARNRWPTIIALVVCILFFATAAYFDISRRLM